VADELADKVMAIVASVKHIPIEQVKIDSSLIDLGFDSLDTITLLFELENAFQVSIPDESARTIRYIQEIVDGIRTLQATQHTASAPPAAGS
jgi:acyl carrier protein